MTAWAHTLRRVVFRSEPKARELERPVDEQPAGPESEGGTVPPVEIAPNDPIVAYFQSAPGAVDIENLELDSPALAALKEAGVKLVVPLVSQGELIGLLNLGPRLSEQAYSADDRKLLDNLAAQAAPAVRVGQLVREQEAEARERERLERELEVARLIQQNFLPKELPDVPGCRVSAYYQPARMVGGDFYDFIELPEGRIGLVVADVTDKGMPAAMVMAATRSVLRASAQRLVTPGEVLERVNELLCPDIPPNMFVTCLYAVFDPSTGTLRYANAGHNVPYVWSADGVREFRATGMPLGLMPGVSYEEKEAVLGPGETMLLYSDGLTEAHDTEREMFGFPRLVKAMEESRPDSSLIDQLLTKLGSFTGPGWEQEDDITLVCLERSAVPAPTATRNGRVLTEFTVASERGNERAAIDGVVTAVEPLGLAIRDLERLKTAVGEATMNAIEHGNEFRAELPVEIEVRATPIDLAVRITDQGGEAAIAEAETPDLEAKLEGLQTPRGWGLFLIENMVDELRIKADGDNHTVELVLHLGGEANDDESA